MKLIVEKSPIKPLITGILCYLFLVTLTTKAIVSVFF